MRKSVLYLFFIAAGFLPAGLLFAQDLVADNMLLYQRNIGGWPKHINEIKIDYSRSLTEAQKVSVQDSRFRNDATIDNNATIKEIRYLVKAFRTTGNRAYLAAAEKGIKYLHTMQYPNGGFPQFYPDSSSYRSQVTFNDNAMINALNLLWDVANKKGGFEVVDPTLQQASVKAINKGVECILKTQIKVNGKLTGWCAQYDSKTLQPAKARAFELVSISGMESVGIVDFLMKVEDPSPEIKAAITGAVDWLQSVRITGYRYQDVVDSSKPQMKDRVLVPDAEASVWARFYDIDTQKPFFTGRDSQKKWNVSEIDHERRIGYAWYGTWPAALLQTRYPAWKKKHNPA
jgi:PelA/Pel-15E family pectate lyase